MNRLALLALLVFAPAVAFAAPGDSPLDNMGDTGGILGSGTTAAPDAGPTASRLCPDGAGGTFETGSTAPCPPTGAPAVPVDGGLALLAIAGAGFAAKRLRARRV